MVSVTGRNPWARALAFTLTPREGWKSLSGATSVGRPFAGFLLPLLFTAAILGVIGFVFVGLSDSGFSYKLGWQAAALNAAIAIGATMLFVGVLAASAHALAPAFRAQGGMESALCIVAYSSAPVLLAAHLLIFPVLSPVLYVAGLWAVVLLHHGLKTFARPEPSRAIPYTVTVVLIAALLVGLLGMIGRCAPRWVDESEATLEAQKFQRDRQGAQVPRDAQKRKVTPEELNAGGGGRAKSLDGVSGGEAGTLVVPPSMKSDGTDDPTKGILHGGGLPTTRTVLESYLPAAPKGFSRQIVDNYAYDAPPKDAAAFLSRGAYVRADYVPDKRPGQKRFVSIKDMHDVGQSFTATYLQEIAKTGGETERENGQVLRTVTESGDRFEVTEYQHKREPSRAAATYETVIGKRFLVQANAVGMTPAELKSWVGSMDLKGLEERARRKAPIE